jgi:hypothetical protein
MLLKNIVDRGIKPTQKVIDAALEQNPMAYLYIPKN